MKRTLKRLSNRPISIFSLEETMPASSMLETCVYGLSLPEYKALPQDRRVLKNRFLKGLVERITKSGGIFLKRLSPHSDKWNEVSNAEARMKVGQQFRDVKKDPRVLENSSLLSSLLLDANTRSGPSAEVILFLTDRQGTYTTFANNGPAKTAKDKN
jgi:hypothetical protein